MKYYARLICVLSVFANTISSDAQQFKWVRGGGSAYTFTTSDGSEQVKYMCTDQNGNVYAISQVGNDPITADTFHASGAYGSDRNLLLTSYNTNGQMRWTKLIASSSSESFPDGVITDSLGHVYVAGYIPNGISHIGYDTAITGSAYESSALIQFDTNGHFNWIRFVGDNTWPTFYGTGHIGCLPVLDGSNNVHFFNYVRGAVHLSPTVTSSGGTYDLTYSPSGTLLSVTRLDLDSEWEVKGAVIDPATNKLYVCGEINQYIYGGILTDTFYAAAFSQTRSLLWKYNVGNDTQSCAITGITIDQHDRLHFSGAAASYFSTIPTTFSFNGESVTNIHHPIYAMSVLFSTDTNGRPLWLRNYDGSTDIDALFGITQLANGKVAAVGTYAGVVRYRYDSSAVSSAQDPYIIIVDSAGDVQTIQKVHGNGFYDGGNAISSDRFGNIYIGGYVEDSIWGDVPTIPAYHSVGGNTDFFVMKFGMDPSCTSSPLSAYTDTGTHTVAFTFTGTTSGIDSLVWDFGDGTARATGMTAMHTYTMSGTYRACATVYSSCNNDIYCTNVLVLIPSGVENIASNTVNVFPNPASEELNVTGVQENSSYRMLSVSGYSILQGTFAKSNNSISIHGCDAGFYILEITSKNGQRDFVRVVKQ